MNVPKIRIKGFDGEWERKKIGECGTTYSGLSGKSKSDFGAGNAQYITFLNVLTNAHIDTTIFENVNIKPGEKQNKVVKGDILFNTSSETPEEVGYCSVLMNDVENLYLNSFCFGFRPYAGTIDPEFMAYLMRGQIGRSIMKILAQGATRYNLSKNRLCEATIPAPSCKEEQRQIAEYFGQLDSLIEATGKKITSLKQTKQACMQQMFPAEGETTPRVRFKGFEGVWQLRKIGELGTTYSGLSGKSKADFGLGSAQYITFLNVLTNAHIDTTIFESVNIKPGEKQNKVVKGDILFNTSSETPEEVGYCSVLMNDIDNLYLNSFCFGFRPYAGTINPEFMVYLMRGQIGRSIMKILAQGATRYNLSKNRLCEVTIPIPANDDEQQQIAAFFSNMDKQIRIQEQRLEKLKRIKTACLENMFV